MAKSRKIPTRKTFPFFCGQGIFAKTRPQYNLGTNRTTLGEFIASHFEDSSAGEETQGAVPSSSSSSATGPDAGDAAARHADVGTGAGETVARPRPLVFMPVNDAQVLARAFPPPAFIEAAEEHAARTLAPGRRVQARSERGYVLLSFGPALTGSHPHEHSAAWNAVFHGASSHGHARVVVG